MKRNVIVIIALSLFTFSCDSKTAAISTAVPAARMALAGLNGALTLLGLMNKVSSISEKEEKAEFSVNGENVMIDPVYIVNHYQITNTGDVEKLDNTLLDAFRECTRYVVLDLRLGNDIAMYRARIKCMEDKGFGRDEHDYVRIKYPQETQT